MLRALVKGVLLSVDALWITKPQEILGLENYDYRRSKEYPFGFIRNRNDERIPFYSSEYSNKLLTKAGKNIADSQLYETNLHQVNFLNTVFYRIVTGKRIEDLFGLFHDKAGANLPYNPPIIIDFSNQEIFTHAIKQVIDEILQIFHETAPKSSGGLGRFALPSTKEGEFSRVDKLPSSMNIVIPTIIATFVVSDLESISNEIERYLEKKEDRYSLHVTTDRSCIFGLDPFGSLPESQHDYIGWKSGYGLVPGHQLFSFFFTFVEGKRAVDEIESYDEAKDCPKLKQKDLRDAEINSIRDCVRIIFEMKEYSLVLDTLMNARDNCVEVLDNIPTGNSSNREERLKLLLAAHEKVQIHERAQFIIREWIEYKENVSSKYYRWPTPVYDELVKSAHVKTLLTDRLVNLYSGGLNLENITVVNQSLKTKIDNVEKSIRFRVDIERTAVQLAKEEYESKKEFLFNRISIVLGAFVIFEILGSFVSWYYSQGDFNGIILWISMLVSIVALAIWAITSKIPEKETIQKE